MSVVGASMASPRLYQRAIGANIGAQCLNVDETSCLRLRLWAWSRIWRSRPDVADRACTSNLGSSTTGAGRTASRPDTGALSARDSESASCSPQSPKRDRIFQRAPACAGGAVASPALHRGPVPWLGRVARQSLFRQQGVCRSTHQQVPGRLGQPAAGGGSEIGRRIRELVAEVARSTPPSERSGALFFMSFKNPLLA